MIMNSLICLINVSSVSSMNNLHLARILLQPGHQLAFTDLQLSADLIEAVRPVEIFGQGRVADAVFVVIVVFFLVFLVVVAAGSGGAAVEGCCGCALVFAAEMAGGRPACRCILPGGDNN